MATIEQLYAERGADGLAKLIAAHLRLSMPNRLILDGVARLLDPQPDDDLALVVVRRSAGNTKTRWIKRREDIEIAREVQKYLREYLAAGKPRRGSVKKAVGDIADKRGIKSAKVQQALNNVRPLIPK
jgi:hypothetical protein